LQLVSDGKSSKEVASILEISTRTVENHRAHMIEKLRVKSVAQLYLRMKAMDTRLRARRAPSVFLRKERWDRARVVDAKGSLTCNVHDKRLDFSFVRGERVRRRFPFLYAEPNFLRKPWNRKFR
jgi:hypothetical protein